MKSKRKSLPIHEASLLKWHMMAFIVFTVGLVWSIFSTLTYPGNANVPFEAWKTLISSRISVIMAWGVVVLGHMGMHQLRSVFEGQAQREHLENIVLKPKNDVLYCHPEEHMRDDDDSLQLNEEQRLQSRYE